jgi:HAD superfamily hydrolase (TIGR01509 family)
LDLSDEIRAMGLRTAVLTNGTDTISAEIVALGIASRLDAIFNSAAVGFVKPDVRAFEHVLGAFAVRAKAVYFTDDSVPKRAGARGFSMRTHLFLSVEDLRRDLHAAGVSVRQTAR